MALTHFSLFTGIGGMDLAAEWAGFETVGQCEWADYPTKILEKHWPDVPKWRDIRSVTAESFYNRTGLRTVDVISGGFPCQPFSVAGKRKGQDDDRYLWPEMLRVISELRPTWVVGENVAGIINMALDKVLSDLETQNYSTQAFVIPVAGVGAPHRRKRVFILGYSEYNRFTSVEKLRSNEKTSNQWWEEEQAKAGEFERTSRPIDVPSIYRCKNGSKQDVANTKSKPSATNFDQRTWKTQQKQPGGSSCSEWFDWWEIEPCVGRVANGIPSVVDRLRCLGNAVVPQQVYPIFQAIAHIQNAIQEGDGS